MTEELKSCPFCNEIDNSDIELYGRSRLRVYSSWVVDGHIYFVKCEACGARGSYFFTEKEAIAAWNTRHTPCDLSSIDNITLMAESVRRGLATVESDRLPQWAIAMINHMIDACNIKNEDYALGYLAALDDVLYLRKPEDKE